MPERQNLDQLCRAFNEADQAEKGRLLAGIARLLLRKDRKRVVL